MKDGANAASIAASVAAFSCMNSRFWNLDQILVEALEVADREVYNTLKGSGGAALVMMAWSGAERFIGHVGDARAYLVQDDGKFSQLTIDDTVKGQLDNMGRGSNQESSLHSQLLQFIGMGKDLEPHVSRIPPGGRCLVLTSDGVHCLPLPVMEWAVRASSHLQQAAERLISASEWNGGTDNGTTIIVGLQQNQGGVASDLMEFWTLGEHLVVMGQEHLSCEQTTRRRGDALVDDVVDRVRAEQLGGTARPRGRDSVDAPSRLTKYRDDELDADARPGDSSAVTGDAEREQGLGDLSLVGEPHVGHAPQSPEPRLVGEELHLAKPARSTVKTAPSPSRKSPKRKGNKQSRAKETLKGSDSRLPIVSFEADDFSSATPDVDPGKTGPINIRKDNKS